MRKVTLAALTGLGLAYLAAPSAAHAAVFSIAPAIQAAGEQGIGQAAPVEEVRTTTGSSSRNRRRTRSRGTAQSSRSGGTTQR